MEKIISDTYFIPYIYGIYKYIYIYVYNSKYMNWCCWWMGVGDGQGILACCNPLGLKESDRLSNWTELIWTEFNESVI